MKPVLWLDRLILEQAGLYTALLGLDEETLARRPLCGEWTAHDLLAHMAGWEAGFTARYLPDLLAGRGERIPGVEVQPYNAEQVARRRGRALPELTSELAEARAAIVHALEGLPPEELARQRALGGRRATVESWALRINVEHNAEHAGEVRSWRKAEKLPYTPGPRCLLQAALGTTRQAFDRLVLKMPSPERDSAAVCGPWTAKDIVGHLADWESFMSGAAAQAPQVGGVPQEPHWVNDLDAWNGAHVALRRDQPWERNWADYQAACRVTDQALAALSDAQLAHYYPHHYATSPYAWLAITAEHDLDHARQILGWLEARG